METTLPPSPAPMSCDLAPRDPIVPVPFDFPLRTYSRWLYPFISRYNYGSQTPYGDWSQISKAVLQRAIATGRFRYIPKLSERHLTAHLQETMTYYYTGSRRRNILLLCLDVDAHEGQPDAPALAEYLATKYLRNNCALEPSTHKEGRHIYFLASFDPYTSTANLFALTRELNGMMEVDRKRAGFQSNIDPDTGGLPSDWKHDKMAHLIKLPRPKTEADLQRLLALTPMPLGELVAEARRIGAVGVSLGSQQLVPPKGGDVPCVSNNIMDCGTLPIIDLKTQDAPLPPLGNPCVSYSIMDCENNGHTKESSKENIIKENTPTLDIGGSQRLGPSEVEADPCVSYSIMDCGTLDHEQRNKMRLYTNMKADIDTIKQRNPLYRALWTVRGLARAYGRMPNIAEALNGYDEFGIGTGPCTDRRIRRFESVIAFVARTFDPKKIKRTGFVRQYPFLKRQIEQALKRTPVILKHSGRIVSVDNLCVALYFAQYQLSRGDDQTNCGTLPIKGIVELSKRLQRDHGLRAIPNQKASACRRVLCQLGLLQLTDDHYQFWGVRRAKRYRLR